MTLIAHAVRAVQRGMWVFPVNPCGTVCPQSGDLIDKQPLLVRPGKPWKLKWGEVATNDINTVVAWWTWHPHANIGIAAAPSGLLVIDLDIPKRPNALVGTPYEDLHGRFGPWLHGEDVLREMCVRYGVDWQQLMDTYRVGSGSGGAHIYTRWPDGVQASQSSPMPEFIDIRCNGGSRGGYVLGGGSVTTKGPYVIEADLPIRATPAAFVEAWREKPRPPVLRQPADPNALRQPGRSGGGGQYGGLVDTVRYAPPGARHMRLVWAARAMCEDGAPQAEAEDLLSAAAADTGMSDQEARRNIRDGYRLQLAKG